MSRRGKFSRAWIALVAVPVVAAAAASQQAAMPLTGAVGAGQGAGERTGAAANSAAGTAVNAAAGAVARTASGAGAATSTGGWQVLTGHVIPNLAQMQQLGALPQGQKIQVGVALANPNAAAEQAAAQAVYNPSSASYHHYFTPARWAAQFSVGAATFNAISHQLTGQGLRVVYTAPTRDYATLSGTVAQVERTFGVTLDNYATTSGYHFYANTAAPRVPNGVNAVIGLETLSRQLPKVPVQSTHQGGPCVQHICTGLITAQDLWSIYDQPSSNRGRGQKMAIIGEGDMSQPVTDLRTYENRQSPAFPLVNVKEIAVANDQTDTSGEGEWTIDTQASTGMAPDVEELDLYFAQSLAVATGAFSVWVNDANGPLQASASFGGCESINLALGTVQAEQPIFAQAAAEGRTLFVSTGDTGGSCYAGPVGLNGVINTVVPQVEWPASSNWVVAVGGTVLFASDGANPHRVLERAWESTGGGSSFVQPEQPWQAPITVVAGRCLVDDTIAPRTTPTVCRGLPDVAAMSGDIAFNQYDITTGNAQGFGAGTSLSSPLWLGMWTRVNAAAAAPGLGFAAPQLYGQGNNPAKDANDFFDVSVGTNGQFQALARNATVDPSGWDYVSGLGVADVAHLMQDLTGSLTPSNNTAPIGGNGATKTTDTCTGNGTLYAPEGNEPFPFAAASVTKVVPSFSSATQSITVTFTVPQMSQAQGKNELDFYYTFSYLTHPYQLDATYDPVQGNSFSLFDLNGTPVPVVGIPLPVSVMALSTALTGGFNFTTGTATITMTLADFNNKAHPTTNLAPGAQLTNPSASSGYEYTTYSNVISDRGCPFTLM